MLLRNLVLQPVGELFQVRLSPDGNFQMGTTILGSSFTIRVRTFVDNYSYFSITLDNKIPLCIMTLGRLGINLVSSPATTLDNKYHVFYLRAENRDIRTVHHSLFGNGIDLMYYQCPTYAVVDSLII